MDPEEKSPSINLTPAQARKMAEAVLEQWILSDEACEGEDWAHLCVALQYDPYTLRRMVIEAREMYPRLKCGHYNIAANIYTSRPRGNRVGIQCRQCAGEGKRRSKKVSDE